MQFRIKVLSNENATTVLLLVTGGGSTKGLTSYFSTVAVVKVKVNVKR